MLAEGTICRSGNECRSFICFGGRCAGPANACSLTAATREECKGAQFQRAACAPGKFDRILTNLNIREGMGPGNTQTISCFNATVPDLEVARCVVVNDGAIGRYGLACGPVLIRGLNDGDAPPVKSNGAASGVVGMGLAAVLAAVVTAAMV
jgi:hypothetical protein